MRAALCLFTLLCTGPLAAHDFWIEPASFRPAAGSVVAIRLRVGENFAGEPVGRNPELLERFSLVTAHGEIGVPGRDGYDPAGIARIEEGGASVIVYRSRGSVLELDREKFEKFVDEEGLEWLRRERARRGEAKTPWRESFSRCAKSLLAAGPNATYLFRQPVGLRLELVPETNPFAVAPGEKLPVRLEFEGKPLAGTLVVAMNANDPSVTVKRRTDRRGIVTLPLARDGAWLVKAVHVVRAPEGSEAEWESLWASLTFAVR